MASLREMGFNRVLMLTGDDERTAKAIADRMGITEFRAQILPTDKAGIVQELTAQGCKVLTYAISFVVIFNYWNYHHNFFSIVNNINQKVIWLEAFSLFVISFLPFITIFVSNNFNTFIAQFLYGFDFIII